MHRGSCMPQCPERKCHTQSIVDRQGGDISGATYVDGNGHTVSYGYDYRGSAVLKDGAAVYTPGLRERRGTTSKFYHGDALGSTRGITNTSQAVTDTVLYDAFGMTISRTGTTPTPFGFVGKGIADKLRFLASCKARHVSAFCRFFRVFSPRSKTLRPLKRTNHLMQNAEMPRKSRNQGQKWA